MATITWPEAQFGLPASLDPETLVLPAGFTSGEVGAMTFREEFNGTDYDSSKWRPTELYRATSGDADRANYEISDGTLKIWNVRNPDGSWNFGRAFSTEGNAYLAADVDQQHRFSQKYGIFEVECKMPTGPGHWPAFWLYGHPGTRRPEIDIFETYPGAAGDFATASYQPEDFQSTVHDGPDGSTTVRGDVRLSEVTSKTRLDTAFHKYAVLWDAAGMEFFYDGTSIGSVSYAMDALLFIIISMGTTANTTWFAAPGREPAAEGPSGGVLEVRYIRAWALPDDSTVVAHTCPDPLSV